MPLLLGFPQHANMSQELRSRASGGRDARSGTLARCAMILPGTRATPVAFSGLTLLAFVALFVLADHTERYFA